MENQYTTARFYRGLLALLCAVSASTDAQWSTNPTANNPISVGVAGDFKSTPAIASDGSGGAIIAWDDMRNFEDGDNDIYAQRISISGIVQWTIDGIAISTANGGSQTPTIINDGAGGAIITWNDGRSGADGIYAQRINALGTVQWTVDGVAISTAAGDQILPTITSDGSGGAIITWGDLRNGNNDYDIYAQRIDALGIVQWTVDGVAISAAAGAQSIPTIASDGSGGAIITWHDFRSGNADIYAQRINASGVVQWTADGVAISSATGDQSMPNIIPDGWGGSIIAWIDNRSGNLDIYTQRINALGVVQWTADGVAISISTGDQTLPTIASDGSGGAIITWNDFRSTSNYDIYAQRIDGVGLAHWTTDGVAVCTAVANQTSATIESDGSGGGIITWSDRRSGGGNADIYAQRIKSSGAMQWATDGIAIATSTVREEIEPRVVSDGAEGAIITWYAIDIPDLSKSDIHTQLVTAGGAIGVNNTPLGSSIVVHPADLTTGAVPATLTFSSVTVAGNTTLATDTLGAAPPSGFHVGSPPTNYNLTTTASYEGSVQVCINYTSTSFDSEFNVRLFHFESSSWVDITSTLDTALNTICGSATTLSPFAVFERSVPGTISGTINVGSDGLQGVTVKLLDVNGNPVLSFPPVLTNSSGAYTFSQVPSGLDYQIMVVEPLGYTVDQNPKALTLPTAGNGVVDFALTEAVVANNARGPGYWKHQFDEHRCHGNRWEERREAIEGYIASVHQHFTPHFDLFENLITFDDWDSVLTLRRHPTMLDRAKKQLATLVMNFVSLKIGQYTIVTQDNRTAGDVLTYVSMLVTDGLSSNDGLARDLAMKVNNRSRISTGIVPQGGILYKGNGLKQVNWTFDYIVPKEFELYQNYPNPFNPTTTMTYDLPQAAHVKLVIYDALGREVAVLLDAFTLAGRHQVVWNADQTASGMYVCRIVSGGNKAVRKVLLLR